MTLPLRAIGSLVVLGLFVASAGSAQSEKFAGISGGATLSDMYGAGLSSDSRWGGMAGLFLGYHTWRTVVSLEANWLQKGGDGLARLDYVEIPLTVGATSGSARSTTQVRFYLGVGLGFNVSCKSEAVLADCDRVNSTEWTLPFGLMLGRRLGSGRSAGVDVRYSAGLGDAFENADSHNRSWQFRAFMGWPLGGR